MIYLMLMKCGLGNQMFSYAYARYLQEIHLKKNEFYEGIAINAYNFTFGVPEKIVEERKLSLEHFYLQTQVVFLEQSEQIALRERYFCKIKASTGMVNKIIRKFFYSGKLGELDYHHRFRRGLYLSYRPHSSFSPVLSKSNEKYVFGYYQDANPLCKIQDILKREFQIKSLPSAENKQLLEKIHNSNSVCLHIRRGDYLIPECSHLNICSEEYYRRGVQYILDNVKNPTFFVFSNTHKDIEWIKENYHLNLKDVVYVDLNNPDYEDLRLMTECKYFVISNSSFSWWAAFLSESKEKIVCMPERWDLEYKGDANMHVPGWIKIPIS